ncbi:MAG: glycosyltransferase [Bacteroidetes bacterium]|nr:glycosyltransferase [Bacteroidota bacterium]
MKIVHLSNNDIGGAGIATVRLHKALLASGVASTLLTKQKHSEDIPRHFQYDARNSFIKRAFVKIGLQKDELKENALSHLAGRPAGHEHFSFPFSELDLATHHAVKDADLIHLHWVSDGFLDFPSFFGKINKPVVWTLHDMNPFTGGCHHADDCSRYKENCIACPQLKNTIDENYASEMQRLKMNTLSEAGIKMQIISPSRWLMNCSAESKIFGGMEHHAIPNLADVSSFFSKDKDECRKKLGIPPDKKIILFVAKDSDNPRKGIQYLEAAMEKMSAEYVVCSVGKTKNAFPGAINFDYVNDVAKLNEIYNAADVFVLPSLAENFPNTICEALLCGTPVVAFDTGGIPELISLINGRLAEYKNASSLREQIKYVLSNPGEFRKEEIAVDAQQRFDPEKIVKAHMKVYESFNVN